jgi:hypothetical protein
MWNFNQTGDLMHYGVLGMKWGTRRAKGAVNARNTLATKAVRNNPVYMGKNAGKTKKVAEERLKALNDGKIHNKIGITKKRQKAFDNQYKKTLESMISNTDAYQAQRGKQAVVRLLQML